MLTPVDGRVFHGPTVRLDGNVYQRCTFRNRIIEFEATAGFHADESNNFHDCQWACVGSAKLTMECIKALREISGMENAFEHIIDDLRGTGFATKKTSFSA
jgi:hypothetical protein